MNAAVIPPQIRRGVWMAAVLLLFLSLAGATYQGIATALERRNFPYPGRLVDIGGHQLHIDCIGAGVPTVVLEASAISMSAEWGWVQPAVAQSTRVCSYDRAGLGWSEASASAYSADDVPAQLRALLGAAGEPGPFVIAGHGLGAAFANMFGARYPNEVRALVLVNLPSAEAGGPPLERLARISPWLARTGLLRATRLLATYTETLPQPSADVLATFLHRPDHLTRAAAEIADWNDTVARGDAVVPATGIPVVRIEAAGDTAPVFLGDRGTGDATAHAIIDAVAAVRATQ